MVKVESKSEMVARLIGEIGSAKSAKFASFVYEAKGSGEIARHTIILNADTENLYTKDIAALETMLAGDLSAIERLAAQELLDSRRESLEKGIGNNSQYVHSAENADTYVPLGIKGMKVHKETGEIHVSALTMGKEVIVPGEPKKPVKSSEKTLAKNAIRYKLPSTRFRQFVLTNVGRARLNGETLEFLPA